MVWWYIYFIWGFSHWFCRFYLYYNWFCWFLPVFYGDDYVATKPLWTNLWRGLVWAWYLCDVPPSWVVWLEFQPQWFGWNEDVTVSSRGLTRPTLVSGSVYDILWFYDIKTYGYCVFQRVYVLLKGTLVVSIIALAWRCQRRFSPGWDVLKKESSYP